VSKLRISEELSLPLDAVTSTLIIYGGKGMGKTNFGSVLIEELNRGGLRWCALDPLGVWWGLRHSKDGKGPGIECLILGGVHGDIPIEPTAGAVAADLVVDEHASVIIDFSRKPSGEMWTVGERIRFVTDYANRLFQRQGELVDGRRREPIFQVLDEAARYIPQVIPAGNPDLARSVGAWEQLVEEGRNVGIGVGLLTQRSARMNKSVSEVADAIFSFRIVGPRSIDAIVDWLGEHVEKERIKGLVQTIRSLDVGRCLVVSPGWLKFEGVVTIRPRETFDSSATPRPGERAKRVTGKAAKPDLEKYAERMKATIEKAKENDPRELKDRIKKLQAELANANKGLHPARQTVQAVSIDEREIKSVVKSAIDEAIAIRDEEWLKVAKDYQVRLLSRIQEAAALIVESANKQTFNPPRRMSKIFDIAVMKKSPRTEIVLPSTKNVPSSTAASAREETRPEQSSPANSNGGLSRSQTRILEALAIFESIGRSPVPKKWTAALSEASHSSSTYQNNLGALRSRGLIDYPGPGMIALTVSGRAIAPAVERPTSSEEILERCRNIVSSSQWAILQALVNAYPNALAKQDLAELAGASHSSSTYQNNLGALRSAGMIEYPSQGSAKASDWLFLE
jgi:hypothetical protein